MRSVVLAALLQMVVHAAAPSGVVRGVVRCEATAQPIADARIELIDELLTALSDTVGAYELRGIGPGTHQVRFAARGHRPLVVEVMLAEGAPLRLDVTLLPEPAHLAAVQVRGRTESGVGLEQGGAPLEAGAWRVSQLQFRESPSLDEADAFKILAAAPHVQMLPESPAAVHIRGGAGDQNLFLLDGAPVLSPVHSGQVASAFSPDIVDALVLHGGAPTARYGGRLSGIVDARTVSALPTTFATRGAFGPTAARAAIELPLIPSRAGLLFSVRRSYDGMNNEDVAASQMPGTWADQYAKLMLRRRGDEIAISSFDADNGLGFPSVPVPEERQASAAAGPRNEFDWATATDAAVWRRRLGTSASAETRVWSARFGGTALWQTDGRALQMRSRVGDVGFATATSVKYDGGELTSGIEIEQLSTHYTVTRSRTDNDSTASRMLLQLSAHPLLRSAFAEHALRVADAVTLTTGLRGTIGPRGTARLEPRMWIAVHAPSARFALSAGYARMHQYSQSLRNEESVLGTVLGPDFLVATDGASIPVATSDELAAAAVYALGAHTSLRLDGYTRWLSDLLLVGPATSRPFAIHDFAVGSGRVWGLGASAERRTERLSLEASYAFVSVVRRSATQQYQPTFAPRQSVMVAGAYQLTPRTSLRSVIWGASGRRTTPLADDIGWDTRDAFTCAREIRGTPEHTLGRLDGVGLPAYVRFDVGVRHHILLGRPEGMLSGFASLNNVLRRDNAAAYTISPVTGHRRGLVMLPLSALVGVEWRY